MDKPRELITVIMPGVATAGGVRPRDFPVGSMESRGAARALAAARLEQTQLSPNRLRAISDPLEWLQEHTRTRDSHWRESGAKHPYPPFPDKPYFRAVLNEIQQEPVLFIEKSRDMMISWLCVGFFTHAAMTNAEREVLFQSQKEDKAAELIDYAKTLYEQQDPVLKRHFPRAKPLTLRRQCSLDFGVRIERSGFPFVLSIETSRQSG